MSEERTAWGWGLASVDAAGTTLDVWYPELNLGEAPAESDRPNHNFGTLAHDEADARGIRRVPVFVVSQLDEPISNAADAYLKLHLMSMRMAKPNTLNLDGIFAQLANVVWTNYGPFAVEDFTLRKADVERASTEAALAFASQAGLPAAAPAATVNVFGRLCGADRRAYRRRRPRAPRRLLVFRHHRDARRIRELQCRHARRLHGRRPCFARRGRG